MSENFRGGLTRVSLKDYTTIGVGGEAFAAFPETEEDFTALLAAGGEKIIIGCGSNIVFSDSGYGGTVIFTEKLRKIETCGGYVRAQAGVRLCDLISFYKRNGLGGTEFLAGIPASVGGAAFMNAGAFGKSVSDILINAGVFADGKTAVLNNAACGFGYRKSALGGAAVYADFAFTDGFDNVAYEKYLKARREKQPAGRSFGSTFKNPPFDSAGRLIEAAGLKGYKVGGAKVSEKHANFIINAGGATARDIYSLVAYIKERVNAAFGVMLTEEVRFIGDFS